MDEALGRYNRTVITFNENLLKIVGEKGIIGSIESDLLIGILKRVSLSLKPSIIHGRI